MKIITWNVNGIRSCIKKGMINSLLEIDADIICLQEVRAKPDQINIDLPGYELYWNPAEKAGYSGTAIITRRHPLRVWNDLPEDLLNDEGRLITAEFENFFLVNCYSPTSGADFSRLHLRCHWDKALQEYVVSLDKKKPVILCGDLNVAHTDLDIFAPTPPGLFFPGITPQERNSFSTLLHSGFTDAFRYLHPFSLGNYSWWSPRNYARQRDLGWRLDYIVISDRLTAYIESSELLASIIGSDHCPAELIINN